MFKIITTKKYKELKFAEFMNELNDLIIETAVNEFKKKEEEIESLKKEIKELKDLRDDVKIDMDALIRIIENWNVQSGEGDLKTVQSEPTSTVKVYKLKLAKDKKNVKGFAWKCTKKELDKFISKNSKKKDVKKSK
jgi:hypothetical protein